jgi:hypothetical protein
MRSYDGGGASPSCQFPLTDRAPCPLVHLYFDRRSPKADLGGEAVAVRYLSEGTPSPRDVAKVTASLAERELEAGGQS